MGCMCSKGSSPHSHTKDKELKVSKKSAQRLISSSRQEDVGVEVDGSGNDATTRLISTESEEVAAGTTPPVVYEKPKTPNMSDRRPAVDIGMGGQRPNMSRILSMRNGVDGAQVAAGWPSWLTDVAGEAIKGWIPRKADSFEKLDKVCYAQPQLCFFVRMHSSLLLFHNNVHLKGYYNIIWYYFTHH